MKIFLISFILLMLLLSISVLPQNTSSGIPDFKYQEFHKFEIDENDSSYEMTSEVKIINKYLSQRSLEHDKYFITEPYYSKYTDIDAFKNQRGIEWKNIGFTYPDLEDVFISDNKIHYINFTNLSVNDEIKYQYKTELHDIVFTPIITIPNINYVDKFNIEIEHPENLYIDFKFYFPFEKLNYNITREEDLTILSFDSLAVHHNLDYFAFNDIQAYILIVLKKEGKPVNGITISGFTKWYSKLAKIKNNFSDSDKNLFDSLLIGKSTPTEKLKVIDEYVRNNIRYIADERGYNSIIPRQPEEVLERKYGDCKDRAFLVSAIAGLYGIKVDPALVSSDFEPEFNEIHPRFFDHVICVYNDGKKDIFFDPTAKYYGYGLLPAELLNKKALILDKIFPRVSMIKPDGLIPEIDINITADIDSITNAPAIIKLKNQYYAYANYADNELTKTQLQNFINLLLKRNFNTFTFRKIVKNDSVNNSDDNSFEFNSMVDLSKFIISGASNKYVGKTPFYLFENNILEREKDTLSLFTKPIPYLKLNIELKDSSYKIDSDSLKIFDEKTFEEFTAKSYRANKNKLLFYYSYVPSTDYLTNDKKQSLLRFCNTYFKYKKQMFLLKGK